MAVKVSSFFLPLSPSIPFLLEDKYLRGGYKVLPSIAERDVLNQLSKKPGMLVYTQLESTIWKLENDGTWSSLLGTLVDAKVSIAGSTMTGPLISRVPPTNGTQNFTPSEFIPKSEISLLIGSGLSPIPVLDTRVSHLESRFFSTSVTIANVQWSIQHNLASTDLVVEVYDANNKVWPSSISYIDINNITLNFASAKTGIVSILSMV